MATVALVYGTTATVTCTISSLSSSATAARESTIIQNSSNYIDELITVSVGTSTGTIGSDKGVHVYAYASTDGTTSTNTRSGANNLTLADAAYTMDDATLYPTNYAYVGFLPVPQQSQTQRKTFSLAAAFQGVLPPYWGLIVRNYCGISLNAGGITHTPVYYTVT